MLPQVGPVSAFRAYADTCSSSCDVGAVSSVLVLPRSSSTRADTHPTDQPVSRASPRMLALLAFTASLIAFSATSSSTLSLFVAAGFRVFTVALSGVFTACRGRFS